MCTVVGGYNHKTIVVVENVEVRSTLFVVQCEHMIDIFYIFGCRNIVFQILSAEIFGCVDVHGTRVHLACEQRHSCDD